MAEENGYHEQQAPDVGTATGRRAPRRLIAQKELAMADDASHGLSARRGLLRGAAAAGLVAAVAAGQLARPAPAQAGTDGDVVLGATNAATSTTEIDNSTSDDDAFFATAAGTGVAVVGYSGSGTGVYGYTTSGDGVLAASSSGTGVRAGSNAGTGVSGKSGTGIGVAGTSTGHWGVYATSTSDTALQAQSMGGIGVVGVGTDTGVYGQSGSTDGFALTRDGIRGFTDSGTAAGVRGENARGGPGVSGTTTSTGRTGRAAVEATNSGSGPGVRGAGGIGVLAEATGTGATALDVQGPAHFSRSGTLTITAGKSSATETGVPLTSASLVLVTLQEHAAGVYVLAAVPAVSASSFTVYLSKTVSAATKVAWFVVN